MVRPIYVEADIDGRQSTLRGGPRSKKGGMEVTLLQRNEGDIEKVVDIICVEENGKLKTRIFDSNGKLVYMHITNP